MSVETADTQPALGFLKTSPETAGKVRYRPFGALRLVLAALVMAHHFDWLVPEGTRLNEFLWVYRMGEVAVLGFFVLSGLIVTEAALVLYVSRPLAFTANRGLRIIPPLLLAFFISVVAHLALVRFFPTLPAAYAPNMPASEFFQPGNLVANVVAVVPFAENAGKAAPLTYSFLPYTWAIRIELEFYVLLALALWAGAWINLTGLLTGLAVFAAAASFWRLPFGHYACFFALGGTLYFALRGALPAWPLAIVLAAACVHSFDARAPADDIRTWIAQRAVLAVEIIAMSVLFHLRTVRLKRLDRRLGELSYPLYLNQYIIVIAALTLLRPSPAVLLGSVPAAILLADLAGRAIEPLTKSLRDRIRGGPLG